MRSLFRCLDGIAVAFAACLAGISVFHPFWWFAVPAVTLLFLWVNVFPSVINWKYKSFRLRVCAGGADLLCAFLIGAVISVGIHIAAFFCISDDGLVLWVISFIVLLIVLPITLLNGIIRVYLTSAQLGVKHRFFGILFSIIPIINIIVLCRIIAICTGEVDFENQKELLNEQRKDEQICHTRYPILLVHGVFFRDFRHFNYWGRIPKELERNGAVIYYGNHQSALAVADSGKELSERIRQILSETGCEKVNIIAHSKGGLDSRYAISKLGEDEHVASLTTINTPHRGCIFADHLIDNASENLKRRVSGTYNTVLKKLGDKDPDFMSAVTDLTASRCKIFNENTPDSDKVYYQSVGSKIKKAVHGRFPLNCTYHLTKRFDGDNDGLVSETSFEWGEKYTFLTAKGRRGISHSDMVDLHRENFNGFDVREFYVQLVADLKNRGF